MSRDRLAWWAAISVVLLVAVFSVRLIGPSIPRELHLLTGPEGSVFYEDGLRYQQHLARRGVTVRLVETGGSVDNLMSMLEPDRLQAAFVESGVERTLELGEGLERLTSIGSLYIEPVWLFVRNGLEVESLDDLTGLRVALGPEGSAVRRLATHMLRLNAILDDIRWEEYDSLAGSAAAAAVRRGELDGFFIMGTPDADALLPILREEAFEAVSFRRTAAYERRFPFLAAITLPEGTLDFGRNIPDADLQQLAASVNLVAQDDMPSAMVDLLLDASAAIHGGRTLYMDHGTFPSPQHISLPLNESADEWYRTGPPPLQRMLPFWLATFIDRFLGFAAAVGGAALAMFGVLPRLLGLRFEWTANGYWRRLTRLEKQIATGEDADEVRARLGDLLRESATLGVPLHMQPAYLELRQAMHDLAERLPD